jgi:hypothetical protein
VTKSCTECWKKALHNLVILLAQQLFLACVRGPSDSESNEERLSHLRFLQTLPQHCRRIGQRSQRWIDLVLRLTRELNHMSNQEMQRQLLRNPMRCAT